MEAYYLSKKERSFSASKNDNDLLSSIGTAQMELEIRRTVDQLKNLSQKQYGELVKMGDMITPLQKEETEEYVRQAAGEVSKYSKDRVKRK